jgi:hypothetical protein
MAVLVQKKENKRYECAMQTKGQFSAFPVMLGG